MSGATPKNNNHLEWTLRIVGIVLALAAVWVYFIPAPPPLAGQQVVGDPISACAYPAEQFNPKKVDQLALMDGVRPVTFDEFNDWRNAHQAGYLDCK